MLKQISLFAAVLMIPAIAGADMASDFKEAARKKAAGAAQEKLGIPSVAPAEAKAYIISPKNGDTVSSPVKVQFGLSGMGVAPAGTQVDNTGHFHLLIDDPQVDYSVPLPTSDQVRHYGKGQIETSLDLKPGTHTLLLVLGDWKHQPFNPSVQSEKITITVK